MNRKIYYWKLRDSEMQLGERTLLMGVLNVTPDSFSDGGRFNDPDRAYARALELEEHGADIIDIGAESTRPGAKRITADEEWQRLVPILKRLRGNLRVPLSLDTYKSEIAERALQYGVEILNDPSGLTFDPALAKVAANGSAGLILNHMRGQPETWAKLPPMQDALGTIARELEATASRARHAGVDRTRIVIDPGLGFGKRKEQNAEILAHLKELAKLDYPILVGPSRKSFLAQASEGETLYATAAAVAAAILNGAHIVRVHDVKEMQAVVLVSEEIARAAVPKVVPGADDRIVVRAHTRTGPNFDAERPRPTRAPIAKPPVEIVAPPVEETAEPVAAASEPPSSPPPAAPATPPRRPYTPRVNDRDDRPRRTSYPDRDKGDGSRPPRRPFSPRPTEGRTGPPARGRDFRPGQGAKRPFERDRERPSRADGREERRPAARSGPPRPRRDDDGRGASSSRPGFKSGGGFKSDRPRPFDRGGETRGDRPPRRSEGGGDSQFRPPRSGPPRSGPPRSGPPRSGPPRAGSPRSGPPRSGPPRGDRPGGGASGPPKRPFRKRP